MRIIVSGTANVGKSTFVDDFIKRYPNYRKASFDYRALLSDKKTHSKNTNVELQSAILQGMLDEIASWKKDDCVIMDRGPLDNIIYSLWCHDQGKKGFTQRYIEEAFEANALISNMIDMIIFVPMTDTNPIEIVEDGKRETDEAYIKSIDTLFKAVFQEVSQTGESPMFYPRRIPGIVEVFGSREERIKMMELLLDDKGEVTGRNGMAPVVNQKDALVQFEKQTSIITEKRKKSLSAMRMRNFGPAAVKRKRARAKKTGK